MKGPKTVECFGGVGDVEVVRVDIMGRRCELWTRGGKPHDREVVRLVTLLLPLGEGGLAWDLVFSTSVQAGRRLDVGPVVGVGLGGDGHLV